jgi:hypothetical protein
MTDLRHCRLAGAVSFTAPHDGLFETSARIVCDNRSVIFQMAETAVPCALFQQILTAIAALRLLPPARS